MSSLANHECESCKREIETEQYLLNDFDVHDLCLDCWIIVYGEGRYDETE